MTETKGIAKRALDFLTSPMSAEKAKAAKKWKADRLLTVSEENMEVERGGETVLKESVQAAVFDSMKDSLAIFIPASPSEGGEGKSGGSGSGGGGDCDVLARIIPALAPVLARAVSAAVEKAMEKMMSGFEERIVAAAAAAAPASSPSQERLMSAVRTLTWDNDRLQQYTRRESVRIWGLPQAHDETKEDVEKKVLKVFKDSGAEIEVNDIAVAHRTGKPARGLRPVLVKFVSRRKRNEVMSKKKHLKGQQGYDKIFINEDLTQLRSRLLGYVKRLEGVERAWTIDGRIHCLKKVPVGLQPELRPKPVIIETPDDLWLKLGVDSVNYKELGLKHLAEGGFDD